MKAVAAVLALGLLAAGCLSQGSQLGPYDVAHAEALLRASPYANLLVRIEYEPGAEPSPSAVDHVIRMLRQVTDKQAIRVDGPREVGDAAEWTPTGWVEGDDALLAIHYLTGPGPSLGNGSAAGTYSIIPGVISIYPDSWRGLSGLLALTTGSTAETVEAEILAHEIGHALGLVGRIPMLEERIDADDPCGCHSANPGSLMYYRVHNMQEHVLNVVATKRLDPIGFDEDDLADLAAYRQGRTGPPLR